MAHRSFTPLFIYSLILLLVFSAGCGGGRTNPRTINMQAVADTMVVPDLVVWTVKMDDADPQLTVAKSAGDAKLKAILDAIAHVAIVPGSLSRGPARIERQFERCSDGQTRVSRFRVFRVVSFRQINPEAADKTLDLLIQAADVEVSTCFLVSQQEQIMQRLRIQAMDQARAKAQSLVANAGLVLGELRGVGVQEDFNRYREDRNGSGPEGVSGPEAKYLSSRVHATYVMR